MAAARAFQGVRRRPRGVPPTVLALAISGVPLVAEGVPSLATAARGRAGGTPSTSTTRCAARSTASPCVAPPSTTTPPWPGARPSPAAPAPATWGCRRSVRCSRPSGRRCSTSRCARSPASEAPTSSSCWPPTASSPTPTPYAVRWATGRTRCSPSPSRTFFGDVLTGAARAASSEVLLKVDDDDWYSPDAVHDLLMARRFSGADVVGMPSEYVYLQRRLTSPSGATTPRRSSPGSSPAARCCSTAGCSRSLGDFRRVRRFVDAQLLAGVEAAGGRIYRTHGLGYVLRRTGAGHTWQSVMTTSSADLTSWTPSGPVSRPAGHSRSIRSTGPTWPALTGERE